jgi:hypothetical protein
MGSLSIAFDKKRAKKFGMRLKTVVTLHRQKTENIIHFHTENITNLCYNPFSHIKNLP